MIYFKYGTTLLAVLIKDNYILCLKWVMETYYEKKNQEVIKVLPNDKKISWLNGRDKLI